MQLLKLKPATQLINGIQTPCYGIYCGDYLVRTVSVFNYCDTLRMVRRANEVMERQARALVDQARRAAASRKALEICAKLGSSRERLTRKTIIAANKARALWI